MDIRASPDSEQVIASLVATDHYNNIRKQTMIISQNSIAPNMPAFNSACNITSINNDYCEMMAQNEWGKCIHNRQRGHYPDPDTKLT